MQNIRGVERKVFMSTIFISPARYVQGVGEMNNIGTYAEKYGKKALCLISNGG